MVSRTVPKAWRCERDFLLLLTTANEHLILLWLTLRVAGGGYLCEQARDERAGTPLDCKMFLFDFHSIGANPGIKPETHRCAIRRCPSEHQDL